MDAQQTTAGRITFRLVATVQRGDSEQREFSIDVPRSHGRNSAWMRHIVVWAMEAAAELTDELLGKGT